MGAVIDLAMIETEIRKTSKVNNAEIEGAKSRSNYNFQ
jgi:hypothetical protein